MWRVAGPCDSMYVCSMRVSFIISLLKSNLKPSHESCAVPVRFTFSTRLYPCPPWPCPCACLVFKNVESLH
jgi:hypothetical protein